MPTPAVRRRCRVTWRSAVGVDKGSRRMGLPTCTAAHERRRSCSTNASRSAGVSVSSTTSSASPTESDTAHVHEYALTSMFMCLFGMLAASAPSAGVLARSPNLAQCQSSASGRTSVGYALVGRFRTPSARKPWTPVSRPTRGRQVPPSLSEAAGAVAGRSTARKRRLGGVQLGGIRTTGTPQEHSPSAPTPAPGRSSSAGPAPAKRSPTTAAPGHAPTFTAWPTR